MAETKWSKDGLEATVTCDCKICKKGKTECVEYKHASIWAEKEEKKRLLAEEKRQQKLIDGPRSKAKDPAKSKVGETIPARRLRAWFGAYGEEVLKRKITKHNDNGELVELDGCGPYAKALELNYRKGETVYEIILAMPTPEKFNELRDTHYATTIGELIDDTFADIEGLAGEIRDWYDNLPQQFQDGSKGDELNECADNLEQIQAPDVPENLKDLRLVCLPMLDVKSRGDQLASCVERLTSAKEFLEDAEKMKAENIEEATFLISEIDEAISGCEGVEFPGMY